MWTLRFTTTQPRIHLCPPARLKLLRTKKWFICFYSAKPVNTLSYNSGRKFILHFCFPVVIAWTSLRWDHYLVAFWSKYKESAGNHSLKINYSVTREDPRWYATAVIPLSYLPPNVLLYLNRFIIAVTSGYSCQVTKCNAHLAHGPGDKRQVSSLYPAGAGIAYDL